MARIDEVIHVKRDWCIRECALFDSASDVASPASAKEFGLNGAAVYGAQMSTVIETGSDNEHLYSRNASGLTFSSGSGFFANKTALLTTPWYVRPLWGAGTVEFEMNSWTRAQYYRLSDLISSNGEPLYEKGGYVYECDNPNVIVQNHNMLDIPCVFCFDAEGINNTVPFTLRVRYRFPDGSERWAVILGVQFGPAGGDLTDHSILHITAPHPCALISVEGECTSGLDPFNPAVTYEGHGELWAWLDYGSEADYRVTLDGFDDSGGLFITKMDSSLKEVDWNNPCDYKPEDCWLGIVCNARDAKIEVEHTYGGSVTYGEGGEYFLPDDRGIDLTVRVTADGYEDWTRRLTLEGHHFIEAVLREG